MKYSFYSKGSGHGFLKIMEILDYCVISISWCCTTKNICYKILFLEILFGNYSKILKQQFLWLCVVEIKFKFSGHSCSWITCGDVLEYSKIIISQIHSFKATYQCYLAAYVEENFTSFKLLCWL